LEVKYIWHKSFEEEYQMLHKARKLEEASRRAKELIEKLHSESPESKQWDFTLMEKDLKETYKALKKAWSAGEGLDLVKEYISEEGYKLLMSNSRLGSTDIKYLDLLDCFDCELEDFLIISVMNLPGVEEDYFVVWLDNEYSTKETNLENIKADRLQSFSLTDNFADLSGFNLWNIFKLAPNDCWTFKWSAKQDKWVLHNIAFDNLTNAYLQVLGKSFSV
jgi:hypothetical protein